ncbi:MAG: hypothetical protein FJ100_16885 [Deltaproteobacteria bacterium]|nr:hypothetical protein [Deltaproteobacteria bacterium]
MKHASLWGWVAAVAAACAEAPTTTTDTAAEVAAADASTGTADLAAGLDATAPADAPPADVQYPPLTKGIWTQIAVPAAPNTSLHGVWTDGTTRVVLAGTNGSVLVNDGLGWKLATQGKFPTLNGVAGGKGAEHTFAVGVGGTLIGAKGLEGAPGLNWGPPGGCTKPLDCDDKDPCTADSCDGGVCGHEPAGGAKCCGGVHFADSFDKGLGNWTVSDLKPPPQGGIVWKAAQMTGKDGGARATSPPNAAYFGLTNVPCDAGSGFCGTFDNGNVVGATMASPFFAVPKAGKVVAQFQLLLDVEQGYYDKLEVWVVTQAGGKELVWDKQKVVNSGSTGGKFQPQVIDITKYQTQTVRLELTFDSLTKNSNAGEGVFIDDLVVVSECAPPAASAKALTTGTLFGVWAAANDDAWAVGEAGFTAHWDGASWTQVSGGKARDVWGMGGTGGSGYAVGDQGFAASIAKGAFKVGSAGLPKTLKAVGVVEDGKGGVKAALAVGSQGAVAYHDGSKWTPESPPELGFGELTGVAGFADGTFAVTSQSGQVYQRSPEGKWNLVSSVGKPLTAVATTGADTAWAVGKLGALAEKQGPSWKAQNLPGGGNANAVWAADHDNAIAVGDGGMAWRRAGAAPWTQMFTSTSVNLHGVWGANPNSVYGVGLLATIVHFDGTEWSNMTGPAGVDWRCVWGASDTDVWAGGSGGAIAHWDGKAWTLMVEPVAANLRAVWGLSGNDLWAVGEGGFIYHGNGAGWQRTEIEPYQPDPEQKPYKVTSHLLAVWGAASDDVWAAGEPDDKNHGVLVHWDGKSWKYTTLLYDLPRTVRSIWGWSASRILMAGTQGSVIAFDGKKGELGLMEVPTIATLFSIAPYGKDVLVVGDIATVLRYSPPPAPPEEPKK